MLTVALVSLALGAWVPRALQLAQPRAGQVWEQFAIGTSCGSPRFDLGWLGDGAGAVSGDPSAFGGAQLMGWLFRTSCELASSTGITPLQGYLVVGLSLTFALSALACRWGGFRSDTSLLAGFLLTTAPSSFSRVGHLSLATLWAVIPALMACHGLWRAMGNRLGASGRSGGGWLVVGSGSLAALLCFPAQEYNVFFTVLLLLASYALVLLVATTHTTDLPPLARIAGRGLLFGSGFAVVLLIAFLPKFSLVTHGTAGGPPLFWATPRTAIEQFYFGLMPFTWVIPPPWVPMVLKALEDSGIPPTSESFFWSTGSFLIPIAWGCAVWILARRRQPSPPRPMEPGSARRPSLAGRRLGDSDLSFFAALLGLVTFVGLLWMTMGGLGTLFAIAVSPVLRALTRFTPFVYGASVLLLLSLLDLHWQQRSLASPARRLP